MRESIVDGPGIRFAIFCQGCPHDCPGCHNPETHDFAGGYDVSIDRMLEEIDKDPMLKGVTFSGGLLDLLFFGILQGNAKTSWLRIIPLGIIYFFLYFIIFRTLILKMNFHTPGREEDDAETKLYSKADYNAKKNGDGAAAAALPAGSQNSLSAQINRGLGGKANISDVDACATRLRVTVKKPELVNDALLKSTGAAGVVHKGTGVQVIYGPQVAVIKSELEDYLETAPNEEINTLEEVSGDAGAAKAEEKPKKRMKLVKVVKISSPLTGVAHDLSETPDEAFAGRMMGDGAMVVPSKDDPVVYAPEDGEVSLVFDTKHAIGLTTDSGVELLIHVGVDTVKLNGQGFTPLVETGQRVKKGEPMLKLDLDFLEKNAPSIATPVMDTEMDDTKKIRLLTNGPVKAGEELFAIDYYEEEK